MTQAELLRICFKLAARRANKGQPPFRRAAGPGRPNFADGRKYSQHRP